MNDLKAIASTVRDKLSKGEKVWFVKYYEQANICLPVAHINYFPENVEDNAVIEIDIAGQELVGSEQLLANDEWCRFEDESYTPIK